MFVFQCLICDDGVPNLVHDCDRVFFCGHVVHNFDHVVHDCGHVVYDCSHVVHDFNCVVHDCDCVVHEGNHVVQRILSRVKLHR